MPRLTGDMGSNPVSLKSGCSELFPRNTREERQKNKFMRKICLCSEEYVFGFERLYTAVTLAARQSCLKHRENGI